MCFSLGDMGWFKGAFCVPFLEHFELQSCFWELLWRPQGLNMQLLGSSPKRHGAVRPNGVFLGAQDESFWKHFLLVHFAPEFWGIFEADLNSILGARSEHSASLFLKIFKRYFWPILVSF